MFFPSEYVIYDFETTGLDTSTCDVIEIGAMKVCNGEVREKKEWLIKIPCAVPEKIIEITGITDQLLEKEGVEESVAFQGFADMARGSVLMGHNILRYDNPILKRKAALYNLRDAFDYGIVNCIDTAGMFKAMRLRREPMRIQEFWLGILNQMSREKFNLSYAYEVLGFDLKEVKAHRAGGDVEMVRQIYEKMLLEK